MRWHAWQQIVYHPEQDVIITPLRGKRMPRLKTNQFTTSVRRWLLLASCCLVVLLLSACNPDENVYRTRTPPPVGTRAPFPTLTSMTWRKAGAVITGDTGGKIELLGTLVAHTLSVFRVEFSPDSRYLISIDGSGTAIVWDMETGLPKFNIGSQDTIYTFFNADASQIISISTAEKIFFMSTANGTLLSSLPANSGGVRSAAISSDRTLLATGGFKGDVSVWNLQTRALIRRITVGREATMLDVAFAPDGKTLVTSTNDKTLYVFDAQSGQQLEAVTNLTTNVARLISAPDGTFFVAAAGDTPTVYDVAPFRLRYALTAPDQATDLGLALSPDSKLVAVATTGDTVNIWSTETGKIVVTLLEQRQATTSLAFAPNNNFLLDTIFNPASGAFIWLTASFLDSDPQVSGKNFLTLSNGITLGAWTPDGKRIVLGDGSGGLFVYGLPE
jgi:WD40 repeat protein